jgi:LPS sulfotransferase NodH
MERIIIATTPRTGSNLLMYSLESHPNAISGGEWYAQKSRPHLMTSWENKLMRPDKCNLLKVFSFDEHRPTFKSLITSGILVFLFREDQNAQIESWKRACKTGIWSEREPVGDPHPIPWVENDHISRAETLFKDRADIVLSYEMLCNDWDTCIKEILTRASWPFIKIDKKINKQKTY